MSTSLFHPGKEIFSRFRLDLESELVFADSCVDMIFPYRDKIRFTSKALLIVDSPYGEDDWLEADFIQFYPWQNIHSLQNVRGSKVLEKFDHTHLEPWLSALSYPDQLPPFVHIREGNVVLFLDGTPRSVRSKGGKSRLRCWAEEIRPAVAQTYPSPCRGPVEMKIDIFTTCPAELPDLDRLSTALMDTFIGLLYQDDKQIHHLQPRVFDSLIAYQQIECRTEPMEHYEVSSIPPASMYPLAMGVTDYYVVRIYPQR